MYITRASNIYKVLFHCENEGVTRKVLDCGAAGPNPLLYVFYQSGYKVKGIDISREAIEESVRFEEERKCRLNIDYGDMVCIADGDEKYGCCYSYNSVFHMKKEAVKKAIGEFIRVVEKGGIIYFNLLSKDDFMYGQGEEIEEGVFYNEAEKTCHSFWEEEEAEPVIKGTTILEKERTTVEWQYGEGTIRQGFIGYYLKKR